MPEDDKVQEKIARKAKIEGYIKLCDLQWIIASDESYKNISPNGGHFFRRRPSGPEADVATNEDLVFDAEDLVQLTGYKSELDIHQFWMNALLLWTGLWSNAVKSRLPHIGRYLPSYIYDSASGTYGLINPDGATAALFDKAYISLHELTIFLKNLGYVYKVQMPVPKLLIEVESPKGDNDYLPVPLSTRRFIKDGETWLIQVEEHQTRITHRERTLYLAYLLSYPGRSFNPLELSSLVPKKSAQDWDSDSNSVVGLSDEGLYEDDNFIDETYSRAIREGAIKLDKQIVYYRRVGAKDKEAELTSKRAELDSRLKDDSGASLIKDERGVYVIIKRRVQLKENPKRAANNIGKRIRLALCDIKKQDEHIFAAIYPFIETGYTFRYGHEGQPPPEWEVIF